jgi:hypothetical protein
MKIRQTENLFQMRQNLTDGLQSGNRKVNIACDWVATDTFDNELTFIKVQHETM